MSPDVTFRRSYKESKHFGLLASVFPSHAVYLVNSFLQVITFSSTSVCVSKTIFLFIFQKANGDIDTSYLILIPGDHPGDDDGDDEGDDEMSPHYVTFRHFYKESKHFGLLASVLPFHAV